MNDSRVSTLNDISIFPESVLGGSTAINCENCTKDKKSIVKDDAFIRLLSVMIFLHYNIYIT